MRTTFSHLNQLWASLLIEELHRLGVEQICIAPGSRSTPLTLAAIEHSQIKTPTHFDERGLGFFALGIMKATQKPVAVVVTSGSALANLYPAVVEAYQTQQPLILLTADRPEELVDCGANQAIEQPGIFSHFTAANLNLEVPTQGVDLDLQLRQLDLVVQSQPKGPVHINCPFREPFYPTKEQFHFEEELQPLQEWLTNQKPLISPRTSKPIFELNVPATPGIIIAGALAREEQQAALELQQQLGWPLLADIQSGLRGQPGVIDYPELALNHPQLRAALEQSQQFILLGGRIISKTLQLWLEHREWQFSCQISPHPGPFDAGLVIMQRLTCSLTQVKLNEPQPASRATLESTSVNPTIQQWFTGYQTELSECSLSQKFNQLLPDPGYLMLGNSLPIRLFEQRFSGPQTIISNRGASGIDGLLATAAGLAHGQSEQPVTLVIGDLSLLHDLNSLALGRQSHAPLVVIVLNNDGGNIFDLLPVPSPETLDEYYKLRHGYQFGSAAAQFGWQYHQPQDWQSFEQAYRSALKASKPQLIELITPPGEAAQQLKQAQIDVATLEF